MRKITRIADLTPDDVAAIEDARTRWSVASAARAPAGVWEAVTADPAGDATV